MLVPTDIVPGRLLSRHGRTRVHRFVLFTAALFFVLGLPLLLTRSLGIAGLLCLIGVILLVVWRLIRPKTVLDLHVHGIVVRETSPRRNTFVPFMAMADLYLYRTGPDLRGPINALAFRRHQADAWVDVLDNRSGAFRLRGEVIEGQLRERGPLALRSLEAGEALTFHGMADASVLQLSRAGVKVDRQTIPMADIARLDEGGVNGSLRLLDAHGHMLWSIPTLSLFSADLFIVLMRTMIEAHHYGLTQKNRPPETHTRAADAGGTGDVTGREDGES